MAGDSGVGVAFTEGSLLAFSAEGSNTAAQTATSRKKRMITMESWMLPLGRT
jgi:hypothetical protein